MATIKGSNRRRITEFWPGFELLVHGGVHFAPYRPLFAEWLTDSRAETREVYPASEGFFAVADGGDGEGLRLVTDNGLFYEFVPVGELGQANPVRHWVGTIETGIEYALVVSSNAGVFGYVVGDTVRFIERRPPRLLVSGRTSYSLSAFGEHLIDSEIEEAIAAAARQSDAMVVDFVVAPVFPKAPGELGRHHYIVEFSRPVDDARVLARFAAAVDTDLHQRNDDYAAHRSGGFGLDPPAVEAVSPGTFAAWMKSRGRLGGQNKVPRILNDQTLFEALRDFARDRGTTRAAPD
jgi:hypothetical protein